MKKRKSDIVIIKVNVRRCKTILLILAIMFFINNTVFAKEVETKIETITYTVSQNDTVWNIAKQYRKDSEDIRQTVKRIERDNNLKDATIHPGQELKIKIEL